MNVVNEYFPELSEGNFKSKYGILNIGLIKNKNVVSGYQWNYNYFDGEKTKFIHSYDLRIVREKVLELGGEWIITDPHKAIESYKFNNTLVAIHDKYMNSKERKYRGTSGVSHVTIQRYDNPNLENYWVYRHNGINCCDEKLTKLKEKVLALGGEWIIRDNTLYENNIEYNNDASKL